MKALVLTMTVLTLATGAWAADKAAAPDGKALFMAKCASCHGKDAKGNPAMVKMLKVDASLMDLTGKDAQGKSDKDLAALITAGKGKMPSYKGKLTAAEIDAVAGYIRTVAPKADKK